ECKVCIGFDDVKWHNKQQDDTKLPKRSWKKEVSQWLDQHEVSYLDVYTKSELLELVDAYAPKTKYKVDEAAKQFKIEILR
ncbi:unnamed protein product, partial [Didymodactylos carnosus]